MARKGKKDAPEIINGNVALPEELRPVQKDILILAAKIADDFCAYDFKYLTGVEKGIPQSAKKGIYIIDEDMKKAFARFNVHLAVIDDLFKYSQIEVTDVDTLHDHEITYLMECTEFKIFGDEDNESVVLIGTKHVSMYGRIKIETPKIPLDNLSSYKWYNELKTAVDVARQEVVLYKGGKYTIPEDQKEEEDEAKAKKRQTKMRFEKPLGEGGATDSEEDNGLVETGADEGGEDMDDIFGGAKV